MLRQAASPETSKHDLDPVLAFVFSLVISDGFAAGFPGRNAELYSFLFHCIPKSVGIIPAIGQHSLRDGTAIKKRWRPLIIAHRPCRHGESKRTSVFIRNRVKLRIHGVVMAVATTQVVIRRLTSHLMVLADIFITEAIRAALGTLNQSKVMPRSCFQKVGMRHTA